MQVETSTQIYISKENVNTFRKAKAGLKPRREFGRELLNVDRTPVAVESSKVEGDSPAVSPLKALFAQETADRESVLVYQNSILEHVRARAAGYKLAKDYLSTQSDITSKMRSILVDWLVDVSFKFRLAHHTLFQTVNTIDRFLAVKQISKNDLQLLGATCLMLQSKYEEVYPPQLKDFLAVCDNAYTAEQMLDMEADVLNELGFDLSQASSLYFLQLAQLQLKMEEKPLAFARYILETSLLDASAAKYSNAAQVAGALFLVLKIFKLGSWTAEHNNLFGVSENEVKVCAKDLYLIMQRIDASSLSAVKRKFATPEFFEVSKFKIEKANGGRQ